MDEDPNERTCTTARRPFRTIEGIDDGRTLTDRILLGRASCGTRDAGTPR